MQVLSKTISGINYALFGMLMALMMMMAMLVMLLMLQLLKSMLMRKLIT